MNTRPIQPMVVLVVLVAVTALIWLISNPIAAGDFRSALILAAAIGVCGVAAKIISNWRAGVYLFLVWLLFEDLVRKYLGNSMVVYFGKDVLVGVTYIAFLMSRSRGEVREPFHPPFRYLLGMFVLLGLAQIFNSGSPSFWYGALGLKLYFYYIPLMFVGYALLRDEHDLQNFLLLNAGLAAVISLVGICQSIFGLDFLNPHGGPELELLGHLVRRTYSGLAVSRPPSVFVSDSRFGWYLGLAMPLLLGTAGYLLLRTKRGRKLVFPALGLVAVGAMVTGSRGTFVWNLTSAIVIPLIMKWGAPQKTVEGYRLLKAIRRSFVFVAVTMVLAAVVFPTVIGARWTYYRETLSPTSEHSELAFRVWEYPVSNFTWVFSDPDWLIGHGIGTASLGVQYITRIMGAPATSLFAESGIGFLIIELGILGPVCWLLWSTGLIWSGGKVLLKLKGTWGFPVAASILWYSGFLLYGTFWEGINAYQNFVNNAYLWLLVGILFRLPALVEQQQTEAYTTVQSYSVAVQPAIGRAPAPVSTFQQS